MQTHFKKGIMEIRKFREDDKEQYFVMCDTFFRSSAVNHPVPKSVLAKNFEEFLKEDSMIDGYIFEVDGNIAGFASVTKMHSTLHGGICLFVEDLYIRPDYRSQGIGSDFFKMLSKKFMWKAKCVRLDVANENTKAIDFYKANNFEKVPYLSLVKEL